MAGTKNKGVRMGRVVSYNDEVSRCTFCGKTENQVRKLVTGSGAAICDECIELCVDIISEERVKDAQLNTLQLPKPAQISAYLDNYVVGQESAKRTLSVALPKPWSMAGWWMSTRAFGSIRRLPLAPAANRMAAAEAA